MAGKKSKNAEIEFVNTPAEQLRRAWLAGLGAFSLTRKHGGQWFGRFAEDGKDLAARSLRFARETVADTQAHAVGVFTPITRGVERSVSHVLHRFGIPAKGEIEEVTRQVAALSRKLKAAK